MRISGDALSTVVPKSGGRGSRRAAHSAINTTAHQTNRRTGISRTLVAISASLILIITTQPATAQTTKVTLSDIQQQAPSFLVGATLNRESGEYREGDSFSLEVVSEIDAYVYVIYQQVDGQSYQVFPNAGQPNNRLAARQAVQIPAKDDLFRWRITGPFGEEKVKVIAADQPINVLADPKLRSKRFNRLPAETIKGVGLELGADPIDPEPLPDPDPVAVRWAETEITVNTYPRNHEFEEEGGKRFGVFFGVSEHKYALLQELVAGRNSNLSSPHRDAKDLAKQLNDIGRLDDSRVFTNDQATRGNLEQAITDWLPQQSKAGDTVFIYFSGHGGTIPDDNGDEGDNEDEFLIPNDFFGLTELAGLAQQAEDGTIPDRLRSLLEHGRRLFQQAGSPEKASELLARSTGVTDDLFGHWLQSLDGRQIVVILDICHSGGFATQEKGLNKRAARFDFLDREITRLKDIGQENMILLTASTSDEFSLVRPDGELSVMTYHLLDVIKQARGPLDIDTAYERLKAEMAGFFNSDEFAAMNRGLAEPYEPHHPILYKQTTDRIWLKP